MKSVEDDNDDDDTTASNYSPWALENSSKFCYHESNKETNKKREKNQGRIHGNPVADRWAGAEMRVLTLFDSCSRTNGPMDQRTDGRTDKASYRVACPQLKMNE